MTRRELLILPATAALAADQQPSILVHEHVMVDFIGADAIKPGRYDRDEVFRVARPHLEAIKALGCRRLQECTPNFLGRDPELLARLSDVVGIEIWSNTGLYAAANHKYVPAFARTETAEQLARRWIAESREKWRPRFIKIGVNKGPLHEIDRKFVRAAAITSRETGLTIASHTGDGAAALEQLEILAAEKVRPSKFVWVHAQSERDHAIHEKAARAGAWVEFDGIAPRSLDWHLDCVRFMAGRMLLNRTLISHDAGWYHVGEPNGGEFRPFTLLYREFLPKIDPKFAQTLLWDNPREAFGV
jgi:phosphotriesterase-related protein